MEYTSLSTLRFWVRIQCVAGAFDLIVSFPSRWCSPCTSLCRQKDWTPRNNTSDESGIKQKWINQSWSIYLFIELHTFMTNYTFHAFVWWFNYIRTVTTQAFESKFKHEELYPVPSVQKMKRLLWLWSTLVEEVGVLVFQ